MQIKYNKTQNWGSGVQRMITECRKAGVAEPAYHTTADAVVIAFARPNDEEHTSTPNEPKNGTDNEPQMSLKNEPENDYKKDAQNADNEQEVSVDNDHKNEPKDDHKMTIKNEPKKDTNNEPKNDHKKEEQYTNRQTSILRLIQTDPLISQARLAKLLEVSPATIRRDLQSLSFVVRHIGPTNGGQWQFIDKNN